jgi:hypothetical protein
MAGTLIDGVKQLIFATDGTAELFRGYTDDDGNAQRQNKNFPLLRSLYRMVILLSM